MADWFKRFGFRSNPLDYDPIAADATPLGFEDRLPELLYRVESGSMVLIEGPSGSGKTSLLKAVIDQFKGSGKVVYLDASKLSLQSNITDLLTGYYGMLNKTLFGRKPKGMIILLDNVQQLSRRNCERLKFYFDQGHIKSVVFTTTDYEAVEFTESLVDRIVDTITLDAPDADMMVRAVQSRLGKRLLSEPVIRAIWVRSNSVRHFFALCEAVCSVVAEEGRDDVAIKDLARVELSEPHEDITPFKCATCGERLFKISDNWRCEQCEQFCLSCGSIASDSDSQCPGCGLKFED